MKIDTILENMNNKILNSSDPRSLNVLLEGDPSSGKSYLCEQFAKKKGVPFVSLSMPTLILEQATGIPYRINDKVFNSKPDWLEKLNNNGVLLLDEFNAADDDIQKILLSLLSDRHINNHKIGDKVLIVACQNEYRQVNNYKMSSSVAGRFAKYTVKFDYNDWRSTYIESKLNKFALSVLDEMKSKGLRFCTGEDFTKDGCRTTSRSIERWLLGANVNNIDFLIEDAYSNLDSRAVILANEVLLKKMDIKNRQNEIFENKETADYILKPSTKSKTRTIYEYDSANGTFINT